VTQLYCAFTPQVLRYFRQAVYSTEQYYVILNLGWYSSTPGRIRTTLNLGQYSLV
jgi:hypothetical protein